VEQFLKIRKNSIIITETAVDEPIEVTINNQPKMKAKIGVYKGNKAVRIEEMLY